MSDTRRTISEAADILTQTAGEVAVFAPWPLFTITIESMVDGQDHVYFHAGGQGVWVARMVASFGQRVTLVGPFGGESRHVIEALVRMEGLNLRPVHVSGANGGYIDDRRGGHRERVATAAAPRLDRHEIDDLYNAALAEGMRCGTLVMTGIPEGEVMPVDVFRRLALDLANNGVSVVADISGSLLEAVEGGLAILKVSHEELIEAGYAENDERESLLAGMEKLKAKTKDIVVSLADKGVLARLDGKLYFATMPKLEALDHTGAGDSMTAALAATRAAGITGAEALRLAAAAGAMNVTRHGRGTGKLCDIKELAAAVRIEELETP
ncbi:PfkB family carbohydrate kinase [Antarcticirhabdus aurantiaca]|uniref:PfkB family carbohydrate kinase n=1 Tax=Antarcticirhabdus aurantiaca TaxID=2606717 RepID=A0ACD4NUH4_9HYPH|nr:PfkB family carbohydrate kinase [Antarcticirhabdus aurantiaca]WAJ30252.1 PfkB family carbohydrate kinase [Jeongeuplla avenae]